MAEAKEKTSKETYRLPAGDADYIRWMADNGILGSNRSAVARTLISNALQDLVKSEYVRKYLESRKLLGNQ